MHRKPEYHHPHRGRRWLLLVFLALLALLLGALAAHKYAPGFLPSRLHVQLHSSALAPPAPPGRFLNLGTFRAAG